MTGRAKLLVVVGLALILGGFLFGLAFSYAVDHQARLVAYDAYQPVFELLSREGAAANWQDLQSRINERSIAHRRAADVHTHSINMGILLILLGLVSPVVAKRESTSERWLLGLVAAGCVYPAGLLLQFVGLTRSGEIVAAVGAALAIVTLAALSLSISRAVDELAKP